jgi:transposase
MSTMKTRKKFDDEFKKDAVRLLISSGRKLKDVAAELGIDRSLLGRWRLEHLRGLDAGTESKGMIPSEMEEEIRRLRKELAYAQEQRDILKKACGILSDRPGRGMS